MTALCLVCHKRLDSEDDEYFHCNCGDVYKAVCPEDALINDRCPDCGERFTYCEASITKRLFEEPGLRDLSGF